MTFLKTLSVVAALSMALAAANAVTFVTFQNGPDRGGDDRFTVSCNVDCHGWLFDAETLGGAVGGLIDSGDTAYAAGTDENWERNLLAAISGATFPYAKDESGSTSFTSDALYLLFNIAQTPNVGVLVNTAGVSQGYVFEQVATGSGLGHIAEYGPTVSPVPLPAALPLFLAGLAALGFVGWRKRAALA